MSGLPLCRSEAVTERIYTSQEIEDTLEAYLGGPSGDGTALYRCVTALVVAALVALPLVRVEVSVSAPGALRPAVERHEIRASVGGRVTEVHARLDARVDRGDALVELATEEIDLRERLAAERLTEGEEAAGDMRMLLESSDVEALAGTALRSSEIRAERDELVERWREQALRIDRAAAESRRVGVLAERDLIARQDLERVASELELAMAAGDLLLAAQRSRWRASLEAREEEARELTAELRRLGVERGRLSIAAPVTGTVEELRMLSPGSMVQPGEVVAVISPDTTLIAEALVSPGDIGSIRVGQPVRLHVDAFDYRDWGHLTGRVRSVSADYAMVGETPAFRAQVELPPEPLRLRNGAVAELRKGMTVQARFRLAERSLLRILRGDVEAWLDPWQRRGDAAMGVAR